MRKLFVLFVVALLCLGVFTKNSEAFTFNVLNDTDETLTCFVYRIEADSKSPIGLRFLNLFGGEIKPEQMKDTGYDRKPGKYIIRWMAPFYSGKKLDFSVFVDVEHGVKEVIVTPVLGPMCLGCDKETLAKGIWVIKPATEL